MNVAISDLGFGRMEPFDESFYPDVINVHVFTNVGNPQGADDLTDSETSVPIPCAVVYPTSPRAIVPGVDPRGSELIMIYCPINPGVFAARQLIEVVFAHDAPVDPPERYRSTSEAKIPMNIDPNYVIEADWENR